MRNTNQTDILVVVFNLNIYTYNTDDLTLITIQSNKKLAEIIFCRVFI